MSKVDFGANRRAAEAEGHIGKGDTYKLKEGDNRIRLMSELLPHPGEYNGSKTFKWLCYILDRRDGKVKAFFMPHTIYKSIEALQTNVDYAFSDVPMPYDLTIKALKAGTKDVEYAVLPAKKEIPLTADEESDLDNQKPLKELQKAIREKSEAKAATEPPAHVTDEYGDPVPF